MCLVCWLNVLFWGKEQRVVVEQIAKMIVFHCLSMFCALCIQVTLSHGRWFLTLPAHQQWFHPTQMVLCAWHASPWKIFISSSATEAETAATVLNAKTSDSTRQMIKKLRIRHHKRPLPQSHHNTDCCSTSNFVFFLRKHKASNHMKWTFGALIKCFNTEATA